MRKILNSDQITVQAAEAIRNFHPQAVDEVIQAINQNEWVIVGMAQNPVVKNAKRHLDSKSIKYHYIENGSYFSQWKLRLAIKMWSGWPTFPQVFHKGKLVGGASDLKKYLP